MMREWRRLYRLRGFSPFGMLLVVLLAVLVVADRATDHWTTAAQRRDAAQRQLATMRATIERSRRIDTSLESARARLAAVSGRVVSAADPAAAKKRLTQSIETWLASLGAIGRTAGGTTDATKEGNARDDTAGTTVGTAEDGTAEDGRTSVKTARAKTGGASREPRSGRREDSISGTATAEVAVRVMPRQLLRILEQWHQAPLAMRLVRLEVTVDNPDAPTALEAALRVEAIYRSPDPGAPVRARPSATRPAKTRNLR